MNTSRHGCSRPAQAAGHDSADDIWLAGAWLAELNAGWAASRLPWESFRQGWLDHHHLHPAAAIREELAGRFVTTHQSTGPYYFPDLLDADALTEHAAVGTGEISPGCLRYAGRKPRLSHQPAAGTWCTYRSSGRAASRSGTSSPSSRRSAS
jgi:hypothetical protein